MIVQNLLKQYGLKPKQDGSGNFIMHCPQSDCPSTRQGKQKLNIKDTGPHTASFHCWVCGWRGKTHNPNDWALLNIMRFNQTYRPPEGQGRVSYAYYKQKHNRPVKHFRPELFDYFTKRDFTEEETISLINDFGIYYADNRVYFKSFYEKEEKYTFYKNINTGQYMNATGSKFTFNFNALLQPTPYVILVEGVFDCLRLHIHGFNAAAMLGKNFGRAALHRFLTSISDKRIFIMLDADIRHREDLKLRQQLRLHLPQNDIRIIQIEEGDPDEVFKHEIYRKKLQNYIESKTVKRLIGKIRNKSKIRRISTNTLPKYRQN